MMAAPSPADVPVLAIDGPGGSGKGTVARAAARRLGWHLLDSGALYRLVGLAALERGVVLDDRAALADVARGLDVDFDPLAGAEGRVILEGRDVTEAIRTEAASQAASRVAAVPEVRAALVERQRGFRRVARPGGRWSRHGLLYLRRRPPQGISDRQRRGTGPQAL